MDFYQYCCRSYVLVFKFALLETVISASTEYRRKNDSPVTLEMTEGEAGANTTLLEYNEISISEKD